MISLAHSRLYRALRAEWIRLQDWMTKTECDPSSFGFCQVRARAFRVGDLLYRITRRMELMRRGQPWQQALGN